MEDDAIETEIKPILRGNKGYFLEGTAAGPGRPMGSKSIKDGVRKWLEDNPEDFEEFIGHFIKKNRELAWQMMEGRPSQKLEGDPSNPLIIQISKEIAEKNDVFA